MNENLKRFLIFWAVVLFLFFVSFLSYKFLFKSHPRKICSCYNIPCGSENNCGQLCSCDNGKTCKNGKCCLDECDNIHCGSDYLTCDGKECGCPSDYVCFNGKCCKPEECDGSICGQSGCGMDVCQCNTRLGSCGQDGKCEYSDICNIVEKNPISKNIFGEWAKFCGKCNNCNIENARFINNSTKDSTKDSINDYSIIPIGGVLSCECKNKNNIPVKSSITIDKNVNYYDIDDNGKLIAGSVDANGKCKTMGCQNCICEFDSDCIRFGCGKCIGGKCA